MVTFALLPKFILADVDFRVPGNGIATQVYKDIFKKRIVLERFKPFLFNQIASIVFLFYSICEGNDKSIVFSWFYALNSWDVHTYSSAGSSAEANKTKERL